MEAQYFPPPSQLFSPPVAATVVNLYGDLARAESVSEQLAVCHKLHGAIAKICASQSSSALRSCFLFAVSVFLVTSPTNVSIHTAFKRITLRLRSALQKLAPQSSEKALSTAGAPAELQDAGPRALATRSSQAIPLPGSSRSGEAAKAFFDVVFLRQCGQKELRPGHDKATSGMLLVEYLSRLLAIRPFVQDMLHADSRRVGAALNLVLDPSCSDELTASQLSVTVNVVAQLWHIALEFTRHGEPKASGAAVGLRSPLAQCGKLVVRVIEGTTSAAGAKLSTSTLRQAYWLLGLCAFGLNGGTSGLMTATASENVMNCVERHSRALNSALTSMSARCCPKQEGNGCFGGGGAWSKLAESHRVALLAALVDAPHHVRDIFCRASAETLNSDGADTPAFLLGPFLNLLLHEYTSVVRARGPVCLTAECCSSALLAILWRFLAASAPALGQLPWQQFQRSALRTGQVLLMQLSTSHNDWAHTHKVFRAFIAALRCRSELGLLGILVEDLGQLDRDSRIFFVVADSLLFHRGKPCEQTSAKFLERFPSFFKEAVLAMARVSDMRGAAIALLRKLYIRPFVAASCDGSNAAPWIGDAADVLELAADSGNEALANLLLGKVITNADTKVAVVLLRHLAYRQQESDARVWAVLQVLKMKPFVPMCRVILLPAGRMSTTLDVLCNHNTETSSARPAEEAAAHPESGEVSQSTHVDVIQLMKGPDVVRILASAVAKSSFSANAWVLEAVLQLMLLCFEQTNVVSIPLFKRTVLSFLPFEASGVVGVAKRMMQCLLSSAATSESYSRIDLKQLICTVVGLLSPSAPFDQLNNGFSLIQTAVGTESGVLQIVSAEALLSHLVRQCLGAMLHCSFASVVASARAILNSLIKHVEARHLLDTSSALLSVVQEYKTIAAVSIFSLHAEYCGAVALLDSIHRVQPKKCPIDFSDTAALAEVVQQLACLSPIEQIETVCGKSTSRVHGLILLLSDRLQLARSSATFDQSICAKAFEAVAAIFDTCCQVMCSTRIRSSRSAEHFRCYAVDCRGHPFAYFEDDSEYRLCAPSFDIKIWLTLKEAAGFLVKSCSCRSSTGTYLLELGVAIGVRQKLTSAICQLRHKGAVSLLAEGIDTLLCRECTERTMTILPPLVRDFIGTNAVTLISRRDCGPAAYFNVIFRLATSGSHKKISALCLVREMCTELRRSVAAADVHKPKPNTLHLVYCLLKAVDNVGDTSSDDRLALSEIFQCIAQISLSLGSWDIVNASMLVLAAIVKKVTSSNPSFHGFRHAYPQLCQCAAKTLAELQPGAVTAPRTNPSGRKNVTFVCLLLFASMFPPLHDATMRSMTGDVECRQHLHATLFAFAASDDAVYRRLAAEAACKIDIRLSSPNALQSLVSSFSESVSHNMCDGLLHRLCLAVVNIARVPHNNPSEQTTDSLHVVHQTMIQALVACKLPPLALRKCVWIIRYCHEYQLEDERTAAPITAILRTLLKFFAPLRTAGTASLSKELIEVLSSKSFACSEHIPFMVDLLLSEPCAPSIAILLLRCLAKPESVAHLQTTFKRQFHIFLTHFKGSDNSRLVNGWVRLVLGLDSLNGKEVISFLERQHHRLMATRTPSCVRLLARLVSDARLNASVSRFTLPDWIHIASQCAKSDKSSDMKNAVLSGAQLVFAKACMPITTDGVEAGEMSRFVLKVLLPLIHDNNSTVRNRAQFLAFSMINMVSSKRSITPSAVSLLLVSSLCRSYAHSDVFWQNICEQLQLSVDSTATATATTITNESEPFKTENHSELFSDYVAGSLVFQALQRGKCLDEYGAKGGSYYGKLVALGKALQVG